MVKIITRNTIQKQIVFENIKNRYDHPTATDIYDDLKKQNLKIGLTTIYRILNDLVEEGKVNKIITTDKIYHFDYNRINHIHFICTNCGHIYDIDKNDFKKLDVEFKNKNHKIENLFIQGLCDKCKD